LKKYIQIYLFILSFVFITSCKGQNKPDLSKDSINKQQQNLINYNPHFTTSKSTIVLGAPSSITRNMIQDKNGNTWIATWQGIIRHNGNSFTNITSKVSSHRFFALLEDRKGNFWFASVGGGVYYYDGKSFINFTTNDGLPSNRVTNIYEDKNGNIWFGTEGGASRYDGKKFTNFTTNESNTNSSDEKLFPDYSTIQGLTNNDVNSIIQDKTGKFWFGTRGEACFYDGKTFTKFTNDEGEPFTNVRSIIEDRNGNIWLGGADGLWRYDGHSFTSFTTSFVGYVYEDKKGNIWTSSDEGYGNWILSRYNEKFLQDKEATNVTQLKPQQGMLFGISEDEQGGIWFGTLKGVGHYNGISFNYFEDTKSKK
jgi:ligand-binding sensor domain-containing protein